MNIGFDLDGVMYDWHQSAYDWCTRSGVTNVDWETFWLEWLPTQSTIFTNNLTGLQDLYENMIPSPKFFEFIRRVTKGHNVFYITYRPKEVERVTERFLKKYGYPNSENIIFCKDKVPPVLTNDIELFVEDRHFIANSLAPVCKTLLITKVWNRHAELDPRVIRINSIFEIERFINESSKTS